VKEEFAIPDIHADPHALQGMLELLPEHPNVVFLGDVANKGPSTLGAITLLKGASKDGSWNLLWGNHDILFVRAMLGSLDAQSKLFTQDGGTAIFAELGQPQFGQDVSKFFRAAQAAADPFVFLRQEQPLLSDINRLFDQNHDVSSHIDWIIQNFRLYHLSKRGILYIHAGIPLTQNGSPGFSPEKLEILCKKIKSDLLARELDTPVFQALDKPEESPVRVSKWVNKINNPKQFCSELGIRAIVVGHSKVSLDTAANEPFPIVRHDFGAASCKGDVPSVLQIDEYHRFISHVRSGGTWHKIYRGTLT
jgi:hypothetical protein